MYKLTITVFLLQAAFCIASAQVDDSHLIHEASRIAENAGQNQQVGIHSERIESGSFWHLGLRLRLFLDRLFGQLSGKAASHSNLAERFIRFSRRELDGAPVPISGWISCEFEKCSVKNMYTHSVTVTKTHEVSSSLSVEEIFALTLQVSGSRALAQGNSSTYEFDIYSPGVGRLMFTPRLERIEGILVKDTESYCGTTARLLRFAHNAASILTLGFIDSAEIMPEVNCSLPRDTIEENFSLVAPVRLGESDSEIEGTWWVEYKPDPNPVDDRNFYIIRHKDAPGLADSYHFKSGSPLMCSKAAAERGENFAVWRKGTCYIKKTVNDVGFLTTRFAKPIGYINLPGPNYKNSTSAKERDKWVRWGECDVIQELEGYGYYCKKFEESLGTINAVMMFRLSDEYRGKKGEKSRSKAIYRPDNNEI